MRHLLFSFICCLSFVACSTLPAQHGSGLEKHELRSLVASVERRTGTCYVPITLVTSCPAAYQNPERGECLLAFVYGREPDDQSAIFYTVYRQNGVFEPYENVASGQSHPLISPLQSIGCTS
jgi:hypothetical protein